MIRPKVSAIVPIRNEAAHIEDTLRQLLEQQTDGVDVEILVADGRSTDDSRSIVERIRQGNPQVSLFDNPDRLSSAARNVGVEHATGDFLVVIDGHCEIRSRTYFQDLVAIFDRTQADCLGRPQPLDVTGASLFQQSVAAARNSRLGHHPESFIYSKEEIKVPATSVAVAYRKEVFDQLGRFDPRFDACEDCEFNYRIDQAGLTCYLAPQLAIHYKPRDSIRGLFKQLMRYGRGRVRLARKHGQALGLSSLVPALFLAGLVVGPLICWLLPVLWYVYFGVLALYAVVVLLASLQAAIASRKIQTLFWLPIIFPTIHCGAGWGVVRELLSGPPGSRSVTN